MKPLARWTIGPVSEAGNQILKKSVAIFQKIYPEFDVVVCYNYLKNTNFLKRINVETYNQSKNELGYPLLKAESTPKNKYGMAASGWKLSPPRLRLNSHELWLDNDIIIRERIPDIDRWLQCNDSCIISKGRGKNYGIFQSLIPNNIKLCAGFFGLPPNFNFKKTILEYCQLLKGNPLGGYDEQGLVAAILINNFPNCIITDEIKIYEPHERLKEIPKGFHFVCANKKNIHMPYNTYLGLKFL